MFGLATLASRILGLIRDQVLAYYFGAGDAMDAFRVAFRVPNLLRDLFAEGAMTAAGERAYENGDRSHYSYESAAPELAAEEIALFRADAKAWQDWEKRPPGYRRTAMHWVTSAKKPETRARRLATLIDDSAAGRKIAVLGGAGAART